MDTRPRSEKDRDENRRGIEPISNRRGFTTSPYPSQPIEDTPMIPTPKDYEVNALATQAIDLQRKENITMLEVIETVCVQSPIPTTDEPLTLGNVQAYQHRLQDAVTTEIYRRIYHATDFHRYTDWEHHRSGNAVFVRCVQPCRDT